MSISPPLTTARKSASFLRMAMPYGSYEEKSTTTSHWAGFESYLTGSLFRQILGRIERPR